jgi:Mlc titration factor MtfA (ptsG expression regulator)
MSGTDRNETASENRSGEGPQASIIDAVADLLQAVVDWLRQEAEATVREKVVAPLQRLGLTLASAFAAALLAAFGLILLGIAAFVALGERITYPGALALVGGVYLLAAGAFLVVKARTMQR